MLNLFLLIYFLFEEKIIYCIIFQWYKQLQLHLSWITSVQRERNLVLDINLCLYENRYWCIRYKSEGIVVILHNFKLLKLWKCPTKYSYCFLYLLVMKISKLIYVFPLFLILKKYIYSLVVPLTVSCIVSGMCLLSEWQWEWKLERRDCCTNDSCSIVICII